MSRRYIVWCDERTKPRLYPWLALFERDILYFVALSSSLTGGAFEGLTGSWPIYPIEKIKESPEAAVIVAADDIQAAREEAGRLGLPNGLFTPPFQAATWGFPAMPSGVLDPQTAAEVLERAIGIAEWSSKHAAETYGLYRTDDAMTRTMLDYLFEERVNFYRNIFNYDFPFLESEYYYDQRLAPPGDFAYVSLGAYIGRDIQHINALFGARLKEIIAVEAVPESFELLRYALGKSGLLEKSRCVQALIGEASRAATNFSYWHNGRTLETALPTVTVDELLGGGGGAAPSADLVIQMDIEGAELAALKGAEETIRKRSPYLALAVYHKTEDLLLLPKFVKDLNPGYSFYLSQGAHNVCFAVPESAGAPAVAEPPLRGREAAGAIQSMRAVQKILSRPSGRLDAFRRRLKGPKVYLISQLIAYLKSRMSDGLKDRLRALIGGGARR